MYNYRLTTQVELKFSHTKITYVVDWCFFFIRSFAFPIVLKHYPTLMFE